MAGSTLGISAILVSAGLFAASAPATQPTTSAGAPTIRLIVFSLRDCPSCEFVRDPALKRLGDRLGVNIETRQHVLNDRANYELLLAYGKYLGAPQAFDTVVVIGRTALQGEQDIQANLERLVREAAEAGGVDWTELPEEFRPSPFGETAFPRNRQVYVAYFTQPGCRKCRKLTYALRHLRVKYPGLVVREFNLRDPDGAELLEALTRRLGVSEKERLASGTVVVGDRVLIGDEATSAALEEAILAAGKIGFPEPWRIDKAKLESASADMMARFRSMDVWAVAGAALIDGVNPCAFATILFLVAYLTAVGRQRREVLACGAGFTVGVVVTYFAVGVGLKALLDTASAIKSVRVWIYIGSAVLCLVLSGLSVADYVRARRAGLKAMKLVLPEKWRLYTRSLIARRVKARYLVPAAILLGATVSLVELACTGQVYVPTIIYAITRAPTARAYGLLALYNLIFVLPLVGVFVLVALGVSSRRLGQFAERHLGKTKLALAGVFLLLGVGLLVLSRASSSPT